MATQLNVKRWRATLVLEDMARRNECLEAARRAGVSLVTGELKGARATYLSIRDSAGILESDFATDDDWESGRLVEMVISSANQIGDYYVPKLRYG